MVEKQNLPCLSVKICIAANRVGRYLSNKMISLFHSKRGLWVGNPRYLSGSTRSARTQIPSIIFCSSSLFFLLPFLLKTCHVMVEKWCCSSKHWSLYNIFQSDVKMCEIFPRSFGGSSLYDLLGRTGSWFHTKSNHRYGITDMGELA